ncbi:hypothetical protein ACFYPG_06325 [Micromonospora sp. NPDC005553]|uniref:hypothetical protein n=1 Tax=unclassified Micromonospora TaxID=2617518 RepID=UPI0033B60244
MSHPDHVSAIRATTQRLQPDLVRLRRDLHAYPETGLHLPRTQAAVVESLAGLGLEVSRGEGLTSVTAVLRGGRPGPPVLLRADLDALPQTEATGLDYASRTPGAMHACGQDARRQPHQGGGGHARETHHTRHRQRAGRRQGEQRVHDRAHSGPCRGKHLRSPQQPEVPVTPQRARLLGRLRDRRCRGLTLHVVLAHRLLSHWSLISR